MDLGIEAAGFSTKVCVEIDRASCMTLQANRDWAVIEKDINRVPSGEILKAGSMKKGQAGLLIGGPPCQPFSKSGFWKNGTTLRLDDPRASTLREYLRVLRETLPYTFILENVPGFAYEDKSEGLEYFVRQIKRINKECRTNYSVSWKIINAADFGVPQRRERLFIIGCKDGISFQFPEATHSLLGKDGSKYMTAWDAIGDLQNEADPEKYKLSGRWANLIPSIPEGKNYLWHTERGGGKPIFNWRSRYWNFLLKLTKKEPSWTIQASPGPSTGPFHWKNRKLTGHELRRLQTFPENFKVVGEPIVVQRQLGNAVPAALAEMLGREIRRQFFNEKISSRSLKLLPKKSTQRIMPTLVQPVRREYRSLIMTSSR